MQLLQQALPPEQQMLQRQEREAEEGETQEHWRSRRPAARTLQSDADEFTAKGLLCVFMVTSNHSEPANSTRVNFQ